MDTTCPDPSSFITSQLENYQGQYTNQSRALDFLTAEFNERLELNHLENSWNRHNFFAIPDTTPQDYKEKFLDIGLGFHILAGIRFRSLDREFPFIACQGNFPESRLAEFLPRIQSEIQSEFQMFTPRGSTFTVACPSVQNMPENHQIWNLTLLGPATSEITTGCHNGFDLSLHQPETITDHAEYLLRFQQWQKLYPELVSWVTPESADSLRRALNNRLYFHLLNHHQLCGVIAGEPSQWLDQTVVTITEEFIFPEYTGQGFGKWLQQEFRRHVAGRFSGILGTIHSENIPSLRTAQACGRKIIAREFFFPLSISF